MNSTRVPPQKNKQNLKKERSGALKGDQIFSLQVDGLDDPRLVNFHQVEHYSGMTFRWSEPVSMIRIKMPPSNGRVTIDTGSLRGDVLKFPFKIHWNEYQIPEKAIRVEQGVITFHVSSRLCEPTGEQRLSISCKPLNAENGRRKLGIPVCSVRVCEVSTDSSEPAIDHKAYMQKSSGSWLPTWSSLFRKPVTPSIPIWQVRIPDSTFSCSNSKLAEGCYPACDRVVVAPCEINARHGTGLLIQYLIEDFDHLATVNSYHCYNGDRVASRVHHCLPDYEKMSRQQIYDQVFEWFGKSPPRQAYVVPYFGSDFLIAMAMKDLFKTRVCLHVMDDNCIYGTIPQAIVQEAIEKCDMLMVISPEMRGEYEQRFGKKAYMLPPTVPPSFIPSRTLNQVLEQETANKPKQSLLGKLGGALRVTSAQQKSKSDEQRGILIGNVWDSTWLEMLRKTIRESGLQIDWFANNPNAVWQQVSRAELRADGIHVHDSLWGQDIVDEMRNRPFAIMPTGALNGEGTKESIARLSLPSRVPFMIATAHLPIIVLGNPKTSAARFLSRFDLGTAVDYDGKKLKKAVDEILDPERQSTIRSNAHKIAYHFSSEYLNEWLWSSLEQGAPVDPRFEDLFEPKPGEFSHFFDAEPPGDVHWSFRETWKMINRIKAQGIVPEVVVDVGASTGVWSWTASTVFPEARFIMVDPLMERYGESARHFYSSRIGHSESMPVALSDQCGEMEMLISNDLYGSSLLKVDERIRKSEVSRVEVLTLDELARQKNIIGRTLLKVDVQFAEHLVINGGLNFIRDNVDAIILELTIHREHPEAKTYREMLKMMDQLGFDMVDEMEGWRDPKTGILEQKDTVFVRKDRFAMLRAA